jgi:Iron-containing alcohol dehydrogenase
MLSVFCSPSRYTQGKGATAALGREMTGLGLEGPVLIIAGKTVAGLLALTWQRSLEDAGLKHAIHHFGGECSQNEVGRVEESARSLNARTIVGAGGGKLLDTARAAAAKKWDPRSLRRRSRGSQLLRRQSLRARPPRLCSPGGTLPYPPVPSLSTAPRDGSCYAPVPRRDRSWAVCTADRPVKWPIWSRHEKPGATTTESGPSSRKAGKSRCSPTSLDTS